VANLGVRRWLRCKLVLRHGRGPELVGDYNWFGNQIQGAIDWARAELIVEWRSGWSDAHSWRSRRRAVGCAAVLQHWGKKGFRPLDRSSAGRIRATDSALVHLIWGVQS
jgi:hypothetical protein